MADKITIRFKTDKNGKRRAYYWGVAKRWLPIAYEVAQHKLEAGAAVMCETTSDPLPANYRHTSVDGDVWSV